MKSLIIAGSLFAAWSAGTPVAWDAAFQSPSEVLTLLVWGGTLLAVGRSVQARRRSDVSKDARQAGRRHAPHSSLEAQA